MLGRFRAHTHHRTIHKLWFRCFEGHICVYEPGAVAAGKMQGQGRETDKEIGYLLTWNSHLLCAHILRCSAAASETNVN